jgi:hypothetical protein
MNFLKEKIIDNLIIYEKQSYELRKEVIKNLVEYGKNYKNSYEFATKNLNIAVLNFKIELLNIFIKL